MDSLDKVIEDFNKVANKPRPEEVFESEIKLLDQKVETIEYTLTDRIDTVEADLVAKVEKALEIAEQTKKEKGDKGDSYIITEDDFETIARKVPVPLVEKVIERTEVIREQPIVTNNVTEVIKEVAITESSEAVLEKINSLPLEDKFRIDASHIKNLPKSEGVGGGLSRGVADRLYAPIGTTGSSVWGGITGTLADQTDLQTELTRLHTLSIAYAVAL